LYLEDKYEELAVEAHFDYKRLDNLISNQPSFQCKFYKVCMKDKNILSYHRMMNWCSVYKGKKLLKKYPTYNKNETEEIIRLNVKVDKTIPS